MSQNLNSSYNHLMKQLLSGLFLALLLSSCDLWRIAPQPFPIQSPIPSITPAIVTATPFIIPPPTLDFTATSTIIATQDSGTLTPNPLPSPTFAPALPTQTFAQPPVQSVEVEILGCNTSLDILNGMGEVTNAYVTVKNTGTIDLPNTCALLRANDEGREHPDKKVCTPNLPVRNQITYKLTVDSTYKEDTIIQVDATSNEIVLLRLDKQSCKDISLFGGAPTDTGVVEPIP
ncbi:MAG: hypothetical protein HYZ22_11805 [Chloroflexi bacterium]|nr:hypothetical protein [Chloroflexota bacterium]